MEMLSYVLFVLVSWFIYFLFSIKFQIRRIKDLRYLPLWYFTKSKTMKYKAKYQTLAAQLENKIRNEININSENDSENQNFYGLDQNGNSLLLKFNINKNNIANVNIHLRILENVYTLPGENGILEINIPQNRWKINGLNIEVLEPLTRVRITYNGFLKNVTKNGDIEHVQFNFIFIAAGSPHYVPNDIDDVLVARFLSKNSEIGSSFGFEQFGALKGFVRTKYSEECILNLPTCRSKYKGLDSSFCNLKIYKIFAVDEYGNLFIIVLKNGTSKLSYGFAYLSNEKRFPITNIKVPNNITNEDFRIDINVIVDGKLYKLLINLNKNTSLKSLNDHKFGYEMYSIPADCKINKFLGKALVEFWYNHEGTTDFIPERKLCEKYENNIPKIFLSDIKDEQSQILDLTGGKGCSLGLLASLNSALFTIPDGFIITVNSYKLHLEENESLVKSISVLNDIYCGKISGNFAEACEKTVNDFKNRNISNKIKAKIIAQLKKYPKEENFCGWAVRSSAIGEDSEEFSAAGQNETFLGCQTEETVLRSVQDCWASLYSYQSVQYRWQHGLPIITDMAVVVQKMVRAESAGVLFTCHPSTSDPSQMVITSNFGLGETVVSGESDPDTFILNKTWDNKISIKSKNLGTKNKILKITESGLQEFNSISNTQDSSLTDSQAMKIGQVGAYLENAYGNPRDIEWGFYKDKLYLFQSRPITTLNTWTDFELNHELDSPFLTSNFISTTANIREVVPKAVTVLSSTTSLRCLDWTVQKEVKKNFDPVTLKGLVTYQHNIFLDVLTSIYLDAGEKIDISDVTVDLALFGHPVIDEKINRIAKNRQGVSSKLKKIGTVFSILPYALKNKSYVKTARSLIRNIDLSGSSSKELYKKIDSALNDVEEICGIHSKTTKISIFYQICTMNILLERKKEILTEHMSDFALILSSSEDVISAEVPKYLEKIAKTLKDEKNSDVFRKLDPSQGVIWLKNNSTKAYNLFLEFMDKHGHRSLAEFELLEDSWYDNPSKVITMIQANVGAERQEKEIVDIDNVIKNLKSPESAITKSIVKFLMKRMRVSVGIREHSKSALIKSIDMLRKAYRQLGEYMVADGLIPSKNLIFHLTHYEIGLVLESRNPVLITKAVRREKLYNSWTKMKFAEIMYGIPQPDDDSYIPIFNQKVIRKGTPVCRGVVQARACVIRTLDEIDQLKSGDILITYSTDIGWSPYFPMLSGVVTELGGLVSHGAVVAREYGLPCVVGVQNVLKYFKTGDVIQLNGNNGELILI